MFALVLDQQLSKHGRAADRKRVIRTVDGLEKVALTLDAPPAGFSDDALIVACESGVTVSRSRPYGKGNAVANATDTVAGTVASTLAQYAAMNETALAEAVKRDAPKETPTESAKLPVKV